MDFKRTVNKRTNKTTYYVDNKRVNQGKFEVLERVQQFAGCRYNSSLTTEDKNYIRHYHSYN